MTLKIEKGIPVTNKSRLYLQKLLEMKKDESFRFPAADYSTVRGAVAEAKRKGKRNFTCRAVNETTRRVWRTR
jgi:hypothetical protein